MARRNGNGRGPQLELVPAGQAYVKSADLERIGEELAAEHVVSFQHLRGVSLLYLFRKGTPPGMKNEDGETHIHAIARAFKCTPLWQSVSGYDAGMWVWEWWWERLDVDQQHALTMHELLHIGAKPNGDVKLEKHDVEDFALVVRHYGQWMDGVKLYAQQLALFEASGAPA
jgi:predicted metallopeptidase